MQKSEARLEMGVFSYFGVIQFVFVAVAFLLFLMSPFFMPEIEKCYYANSLVVTRG